MATSRISVTIAIEIRHEASFVVQCVFQGTRAYWDLVGEITQEAICAQPILAKGAGPVSSVDSFPLWAKVPTQWDRFGP